MSEIKDRVQKILVDNALDFRIEKLPMVGARPSISVDVNGELVNDIEHVESQYFGLYNTKSGNILNTVKEGYTVSQNDEVVELVLRGRVFIQLGIDGFAKVGDDKIKRYVTVIDSNDGSTGLSIGIGDLTMSCSNQFFQFYKSGQSKMRHTASLDSKLIEVPNLIGLALTQSMRMTEVYREFTTHNVTDKNTHNLVEAIMGASRLSSTKDTSELSKRSVNAMDSLYEMIRVEMAQKGKNAWGLHSGVTRWTTHEKSAPRRENGRMESMMVGTNYRTNQTSLAFTRELVGI